MIDSELNFNSLVNHPLQSVEWGEFNRSLGYEVVRSADFPLQTLICREPRSGLGFGYVPKGPRPTADQLDAMRQLARAHNCLAIKIEPDVSWAFPLSHFDEEDGRILECTLKESGARPAKRMFPPATFVIDLRDDEELLLKRLPRMTRYNIGVARRHGITVECDQSDQGFEEFLSLFQSEVAPRMPVAQQHSPEHLRTFWRTVGASGWTYVLKAKLGDELIAAMLLMKFKDRLYYPYGASHRKNTSLKAPTMLMWEAIRQGKMLGCTDFDLWTAIDCDQADEVGPHTYEGVHRFASRFGGQWRKLMPAWDLVP